MRTYAELLASALSMQLPIWRTTYHHHRKRSIFERPRLQPMTLLQREYYKPGTSKRGAEKIAAKLKKEEM